MGLLKKSSVYLIGRVLPAAIGVGGVALYTRLLDPASVGAYALLLSTSLLASGIGYAWLRVAALRVSAGGTIADEPDIAATVGLLFIIASALIAAAEGFLLHVFDPALRTSSLILAVAAAVASAWYELNGTMLQAKLNVVSWGMLNLVRAVGALGLSVLLIYAGLKTDALLGGFVLGNCATFAFLGLWRPALRGRFDPALCRRLMLFGWPSSVTTALGQVAPTVQRYMLNAAAGSAAVGIFAVSQDFASQTMSVLIGSISLAGIPLAFKAKDSGDSAALNRQLRENARLIFAVGLPAAVGLVVLGGPIAHVFFGTRFRVGAEVIVAIIAVSWLSTGLRNYYFDQSFELAKETRPQAIISGIGTAVALSLGLFLIPRYAATGAAICSLTASLVCLTLSIVWGARVLRMPVPVVSWLKTAAASGGMGLALAFVPATHGPLGLGLTIVFGGLIYCALSAFTRLTTVRARFAQRVPSLQR